MKRSESRVFTLGSPHTARGSVALGLSGRQRFMARVVWLSPPLPY